MNNIYKLHAAEEYCSRETRLKECFQKGKKELAVEVLQDLIKDEKSISLNSWKLRYINQLLIASGTGMNICQKYVKERTNFSYL
ncbi:hypothetical protein DW904_10690 [Ruminococcus sp. AM42-11]|nr:hypothetical protein DW904_10690 [Ruminococcus sp. AM42-11]